MVSPDYSAWSFNTQYNENNAKKVIYYIKYTLNHKVKIYYLLQCKVLNFAL